MNEYRVKPDSKLNLDKYDPDDTGEYKKTDERKEKARTITTELIAKLAGLQERLYVCGELPSCEFRSGSITLARLQPVPPG